MVASDGSTWVILPRAEMETIRLGLEALERAVSKLAAQQRAAAGEPTPDEVLEAIRNGISPVKAWRVYYGMSQASLARQVGVSPSAIRYLESGVPHEKQEERQSVAEVLSAAQWVIEQS